MPFGVDLSAIYFRLGDVYKRQLLFISVEVSDVTAFTIFLVIGILYDAYYFHVIGIATLLLPLLSVLVNKYNTIMMGNKITRFLSVLILVFLFEFVSFLLANLVSLTSMEISTFIVYSLAPTMVLNSLLLLILQPVLEKFIYDKKEEIKM